jgi:hypothetical protein
MMAKLWPFGKNNPGLGGKVISEVEEIKNDIKRSSDKIISDLSNVQDQLRRSKKTLVVEVVEGIPK